MPVALFPGVVGFRSVSGLPGVSGGMGVAGFAPAPPTTVPLLDIDFATGKVLLNGVQTPGLVTYVSPNSNVYYLDATGNLQPLPGIGGVPPVATDGTGTLLGAPHPFRWDNLIPNPRAIGLIPGTPGTYPTGWVVNAGGGLAINAVGLGTENGIPYADFRVVGTATAGATFNVGFAGASVIATPLNHSFAASMFCRTMAGSWPGNMTTQPSLFITYFNSVPTVVQSSAFVMGPPGTHGLSTQRFTHVLTVTTAGAVTGRATFTGSFAAGAVDVTFRVGLPTFSEGTHAPLFPAMPAAGQQGAVSGGFSDIRVVIPSLSKYNASLVLYYGSYDVLNQQDGIITSIFGDLTAPADNLTTVIDNASTNIQDNLDPGNVSTILMPPGGTTLAMGHSFNGPGLPFNGAANASQALSSRAAISRDYQVSGLSLIARAITAGRLANGSGLQYVRGLRVYGYPLTPAQLLAAIADRPVDGFAYDFTNTLPGVWSFERVGDAYYFNTSSQLTRALTEVPRFSGDTSQPPGVVPSLGLLVEEATTNAVFNPRAEGGTSGVITAGAVMPTRWVIGGNAVGTELTVTLTVGVLENGLPCIDLKMLGTTTTAGNVWVIPENVGQKGYPVAVGSRAVLSAMIRLIAGTLPSFGTGVRFQADYRNSANTVIGQAGFVTAANLTAASMPQGRVAMVSTAAPAATTSQVMQFNFNINPGPVDCTFRIGGFQAEPNLPSPDIPTTLMLPPPGTPGISSRIDEALWIEDGFMPLAPTSGGFTIFMQLIVTRMTLGVNLLSWGDGNSYDDNVAFLRVLAGGNLAARMVSGGVSTPQIILPFLGLGVVQKVAISAKDGVVSMGVNGAGNTCATTPAVPLVPPDSVAVGNSFFGASPTATLSSLVQKIIMVDGYMDATKLAAFTTSGTP